jgi:hypothetical protein
MITAYGKHTTMSCHHVSRASVSRIGVHPMRWTEKGDDRDSEDEQHEL